MTSNTTEAFDYGCWVDNSTSLPGYLLRQVSASFANRTGNTETDDALYDNATRSVISILSVFMPQVSNSLTSAISSAYAVMTCLRPSKFSKGSRVSPALPLPHTCPYTTPTPQRRESGHCGGCDSGRGTDGGGHLVLHTDKEEKGTECSSWEYEGWQCPASWQRGIRNTWRLKIWP